MGTKRFEVDVGSDLTCPELLELLQAYESELEEFLVDRLEHKDIRAVCDDFRLDSIEQDGSEYFLSYSYEWSAYHGCKDANRGGAEEEVARFSYRGSTVVFEREEVLPRFPNDEL